MAAASGQKKYHKSDRRPDQPKVPGKTELKAFVARAAELAETALAPLGLELVLAQCPVEGGRPVLRLFIDRAAGGNPPEPPSPGSTEPLEPHGGDGASPVRISALASAVSLDDCAAASRAMDAVLEGDDREPPEGYVLEVSSPGLDRPLVKPADYPRFAGRLVKLKLRREGKNSAHKGRLALESDGGLAVDTAEGRINFSFDEVTSCRLSLDEADF